MKNLEQIRARNAMAAIKAGLRGRGVDDGDALSGFPALVANNGLLSALAFSSSKKKGGYKEIGDAIAGHLSDPDIQLMQGHSATLEGLVDYLCAEPSQTLRMCAAETMAYLNYLRRFAKANGKNREG